MVTAAVLAGHARARSDLLIRRRLLRRDIDHGRRTVFAGGRPLLRGTGRLVMGDSVRIHNTPVRASIDVGPGATVVIGDRVMLNYGVTIFAARSVTIGSDVGLGEYATVYDTNFHQVDEDADVFTAPVVLEDNVWIGRQAIVLPGVTVGRSSVVAAGSVVTKDIPRNVVAAGNPARPVRDIRASDHWRRPQNS